MKNSAAYIAFIKKYFEKDPVAAARGLETMEDEQAVDILRQLTPPVAAKAINHLSDNLAGAVLTHLPKEQVSAIARTLDMDKTSNVLLQLPEEKRELFLENLDDRRKHEMRELLTFPEDSAGRLMDKDLVAFHGDVTVKEAAQKIRRMAKKGAPASYIYVVDADHKLMGVMNMRDMLLAPGSDPLHNHMRSRIFSVNAFDDTEVVAGQLSERGFFAAPVVDGQGRLVGVIRAEKLIGDVQEAASEDLQMMFGASANERVFSPIMFSIKTRLPWLHVNLLTAFLAASVVAFFEDVIAQVTALAVFLPVVAGQGGNAGAQSLAVVMRGLVMREVGRGDVKTLLKKEATIGVINGVVIGIVTGLAAWAWNGNPMLGVVVALGMLVNLIAAGLSGASIPLLMKRMGLDPAQSSSIMLTTVTDVVGFFAFLGFAVIFSSHLY